MENAFAKSVDDVLAAFSVDTAEGLEDEQVRELRAQHGKNGTPLQIPLLLYSTALGLTHALKSSPTTRRRPCGNLYSSSSRTSSS